jgi:hypothetical protein
MAEKYKLKISSAVAQFVHPGMNTEEKLKGLVAATEMSPYDRVLLTFCLTRDLDDVVKGAASVAFIALPEEHLVEFASQPEPHPAILDAIARFHHSSPVIVKALLESEALSPQAREFLQGLAPSDNQSLDAGNEESSRSDEECGCDNDADLADDHVDEDEEQIEGDDEPGEEPEEMSEEGEEFLSKYRLAQIMGIAEKIKMALTGDKEWRSLLIKDANKLVSGSVIKNPRITDGEILVLLKSGIQNDEIMRLICANKEWIKNYKIRKALVENPRTPLQNALRYLTSLGDKDIAGYAKSKNVSTVVSTQAKRLLLNKKR